MGGANKRFELAAHGVGVEDALVEAGIDLDLDVEEEQENKKIKDGVDDDDGPSEESIVSTTIARRSSSRSRMSKSQTIGQSHGESLHMGNVALNLRVQKGIDWEQWFQQQLSSSSRQRQSQPVSSGGDLHTGTVVGYRKGDGTAVGICTGEDIRQGVPMFHAVVRWDNTLLLKKWRQAKIAKRSERKERKKRKEEQREDQGVEEEKEKGGEEEKEKEEKMEEAKGMRKDSDKELEVDAEAAAEESLPFYGTGSKGVYPLTDWSLRNAWRGGGMDGAVQVVLTLLPPLAGERGLLALEKQHGHARESSSNSAAGDINEDRKGDDQLAEKIGIKDMVGWQMRVGMQVLLRERELLLQQLQARSKECELIREREAMMTKLRKRAEATRVQAEVKQWQRKRQRLRERLDGQEQATADLVQECELALSLALSADGSEKVKKSGVEGSSPLVRAAKAVTAMGKLSMLGDRLQMLVSHGALPVLVHLSSSLSALQFDEQLTTALADTMSVLAKSEFTVRVADAGDTVEDDTSQNDLTELFGDNSNTADTTAARSTTITTTARRLLVGQGAVPPLLVLIVTHQQQQLLRKVMSQFNHSMGDGAEAGDGNSIEGALGAVAEALYEMSHEAEARRAVVEQAAVAALVLLCEVDESDDVEEDEEELQTQVEQDDITYEKLEMANSNSDSDSDSDSSGDYNLDSGSDNEGDSSSPVKHGRRRSVVAATDGDVVSGDRRNAIPHALEARSTWLEHVAQKMRDKVRRQRHAWFAARTLANLSLDIETTASSGSGNDRVRNRHHEAMVKQGAVAPLVWLSRLCRKWRAKERAAQVAAFCRARKEQRREEQGQSMLPSNFSETFAVGGTPNARNKTGASTKEDEATAAAIAAVPVPCSELHAVLYSCATAVAYFTCTTSRESQGLSHARIVSDEGAQSMVRLIAFGLSDHAHAHTHALVSGWGWRHGDQDASSSGIGANEMALAAAAADEEGGLSAMVGLEGQWDSRQTQEQRREEEDQRRRYADLCAAIFRASLAVARVCQHQRWRKLKQQLDAIKAEVAEGEFKRIDKLKVLQAQVGLSNIPLGIWGCVYEEEDSDRDGAVAKEAGVGNVVADTPAIGMAAPALSAPQLIDALGGEAAVRVLLRLWWRSSAMLQRCVCLDGPEEVTGPDALRAAYSLDYGLGTCSDNGSSAQSNPHSAMKHFKEGDASTHEVATDSSSSANQAKPASKRRKRPTQRQDFRAKKRSSIAQSVRRSSLDSGNIPDGVDVSTSSSLVVDLGLFKIDTGIQLSRASKVSTHNVSVGCRVQRGPHWNWRAEDAAAVSMTVDALPTMGSEANNQDGGQGQLGTVLAYRQGDGALHCSKVAASAALLQSGVEASAMAEVCEGEQVPEVDVGAEGGVGVELRESVLAQLPLNHAVVRWDIGTRGYYAIGWHGKYELALAYPDGEDDDNDEDVIRPASESGSDFASESGSGSEDLAPDGAHTVEEKVGDELEPHKKAADIRAGCDETGGNGCTWQHQWDRLCRGAASAGDAQVRGEDNSAKHRRQRENLRRENREQTAFVWSCIRVNATEALMHVAISLGPADGVDDDDKVNEGSGNSDGLIECKGELLQEGMASMLANLDVRSTGASVSITRTAILYISTISVLLHHDEDPSDAHSAFRTRALLFGGAMNSVGDGISLAAPQAWYSWSATTVDMLMNVCRIMVLLLRDDVDVTGPRRVDVAELLPGLLEKGVAILRKCLEMLGSEGECDSQPSNSLLAADAFAGFGSGEEDLTACDMHYIIVACLFKAASEILDGFAEHESAAQKKLEQLAISLGLWDRLQTYMQAATTTSKSTLV